MASTYTDSLGIEKPGSGEQAGTWDDTLNTNFDLYDEAIAGQVSVTLTATNITSGNALQLVITDGGSSNGRHKFIEFVDSGDIGGDGYAYLDPADAEKIAYFSNNLSSNRSVFLFQADNPSTGYDTGRDYELTNGQTAVVRFDGGGAGAIARVVQTVSDIGASDSVDINGGAIDGTTIGGTTPAAGTFTDITASGTVDLSSATVSDGGTVTTVDINGGTIDGTNIGATTPGTGAFSSLTVGGTAVQVQDPELTAIAGLTSASNKVIRYTGSGTADLLDFLDQDTMSSDSATAVASQQSIKAYADARNPIGQHTIWVPAGAMIPTTTNGAAPATTELATNDVMLSGLDFDATTDEKAQFMFQSPKSSDVSEGMIAEFVWTDGATAGTGNVVWGMRAIAFRDSSAMDATWGTAVTVTDGFITSGDLHESGETSACTPAGSWAKEDTIVLEFYRDADNGSDTYTQDARLLGVRVHYTTDAANDS